MPAPNRIEAFAIISADGMIADAAGHMPDALKIEADPRDLSARVRRRWCHGLEPFSHPRVSAAETR